MRIRLAVERRELGLHESAANAAQRLLHALADVRKAAMPYDEKPFVCMTPDFYTELLQCEEMRGIAQAMFSERTTAITTILGASFAVRPDVAPNEFEIR